MNIKSKKEKQEINPVAIAGYVLLIILLYHDMRSEYEWEGITLRLIAGIALMILTTRWIVVIIKRSI